MKKLLIGTAATLAAAGLVTPASAQEFGRQLDFIGDTGEVVPVASVGGLPFGVAPVVGIFWDERCASVEYTFNSDSSANTGTTIEIDAQTLADTVQAGLDRWNENPASYIDMNITSVESLGNRPRIGGDFVNEVTFITDPTFPALASSPSTSLTADATFTPGDDLDGDGDSDVFDPAVEGRNTCSDVDNDGDIEFPAGDYKAGTILDNDVQFSATVLWELTPTPGFADVDGVSTHEFGHSHGLNHALNNQISETDGTGSTMFPFIDTSDPDSELGSRTLHADDLAHSAFFYPEGSSTSGIAALQAGDQDFDSVYDVITGTTTNQGANVAGAYVSAIDRRTGRNETGTYSGQTVVFDDVFGFGGGGLFVFDEAVLDGDWELPVPKSRVYRAAVEALDGDPAATGNISFNAIVAGILGQNLFPEELQNTSMETSVEFYPGQGTPFWSGNNTGQNLDFLLNQESVQTNVATDIDFIGTGAIGGANSVIYAEVFDRDEINQRLANGDVPISGNFLTGTLDASLVPIFEEVQLAYGVINPDGTATITRRITRERDFVGQDGDFAPFLFGNAQGIPFNIRGEFNRNPDLQLFLVLEADNLSAGPSGFPPAFLGLDADGTGTSFISIDGGPLNPVNGTWAVELRYVNPGTPVNPWLQQF
ncbi:MAG: hypothetical protein AAFY84_13850 [Pseudomonadota bacterium]